MTEHEPCPDCRRDPELVWQADAPWPKQRQCYVRCPNLCRSTAVMDDPDYAWGMWDRRALEAREGA